MEIEYSSHPNLGAGKVNKVFLDDAEVLSFKGQVTNGEHVDPWYNFGTFEIGELVLPSIFMGRPSRTFTSIPAYSVPSKNVEA